MQHSKPVFPLRVFYDGGCVVCATEVEHYGRRDQEGNLILIDISAADFDAHTYGISHEMFMEQMHVIDSEGSVYRGVDAFWAIWQAFPANSIYGLFGRFITLPVINSLARIAYRIFARYRKYLPKRKHECPEDSCRIDSDQSKSS